MSVMFFADCKTAVSSSQIETVLSGVEKPERKIHIEYVESEINRIGKHEQKRIHAN